MLHRRRSTSQVTRLPVPLAPGRTVQMVIYRERRRNWRISVGQKAVNLRIPVTSFSSPQGDPIEWGMKWIQKKYQQDPGVFNHFFLHVPNDGKIYRTAFGEIELVTVPEPRSAALGEVEDDCIVISYPGEWDQQAKGEVFPKLISKLMAARFRSDFLHRIAFLNEKHFRFPYGNVILRYNKSTWGSCSHTGKLTFSTRLLLAPLPVIDYVIIHELSHIKVHNHSKSFWNLVASAMPEYKQYVKWLRTEGHKLYF